MNHSTFGKFKIDADNIPEHIGIIMDGNGRWADRKGLPRILGHHAGIESVRAIVRACSKIGIKFLTLYTFSTENWKRPKTEVNALMNMIKELLQTEIVKLHKNNVRLKIIGRINQLPQRVQKVIDDAIKSTHNNTGLVLTLALNYGGRQEIIDAVNKILSKSINHNIKRITLKNFPRYLYDGNIPDPDLIIRTSGELRLSNFLIWETAYSEIWITKTLWPDFRKRHLLKAIGEFQKRKRKFGGVNE